MIVNARNARYASRWVIGKHRGRLHCPEMSLTLVHKPLKMGPEFLPALRNNSAFGMLRCHASHAEVVNKRAQPNFAERKELNGADASRLRWHGIVNVNATIEVGSLVSHIF